MVSQLKKHAICSTISISSSTIVQLIILLSSTDYTFSHNNNWTSYWASDINVIDSTIKTADSYTVCNSIITSECTSVWTYLNASICT